MIEMWRRETRRSTDGSHHTLVAVRRETVQMGCSHQHGTRAEAEACPDARATLDAITRDMDKLARATDLRK